MKRLPCKRSTYCPSRSPRPRLPRDLAQLPLEHPEQLDRRRGLAVERRLLSEVVEEKAQRRRLELGEGGQVPHRADACRDEDGREGDERGVEAAQEGGDVVARELGLSGRGRRGVLRGCEAVDRGVRGREGKSARRDEGLAACRTCLRAGGQRVSDP